MDLLDGLATLIRIRLSSLSAGPDAMQVGVVFAGWTRPVNLLPTLIRIRLPTRWAGPDAMLVGVVFTDGPAPAKMPILSMSLGGDKPQYPVAKSTHSGAARFVPCWQCLQAMMRELRQQRDVD